MKNLLYLVGFALLLMSCKFFDDDSPLGSDIVGGRDDSAIRYEGNYETRHISQRGGSVTDTLSGRHRYENHILDEGKRQGEVAVGTWNSQRSLVSMSFFATEDTPYTIEDVLDSLFGKLENPLDERADTARKLSAELVFDINRSKSDQASYNIAAHTMPFLPDSSDLFSHLDSAETNHVGYATVVGNSSQGSIPLNISHFHDGTPREDTIYNRWRFSHGDSIVMITTDTIQDVHSEGRRISRDTLGSYENTDTIAFADTTRTKESHLLSYTELPVYDYRTFSFLDHYAIPEDARDTIVDTVTTSLSGTSEYRQHTMQILRVEGDNIDDSGTERKVIPYEIPLDTLHHFSSPEGTRDSLSFPRQEIHRTFSSRGDTLSRDTLENGDIVTTYTNLHHDNKIIYTAENFVQIREVPTPSIRPAFVDSEGDTVSYSDTLSLLLDMAELQDKALLFLRRPLLKFSLEEYIPDDDGVDTVRHSLQLAPRFYGMNVADTVSVDLEAPVSDGAREQISRLELRGGMRDFWQDIRNRNSATILHSNLRIQSDSAVFPDYHGDELTVYGLVLDTLFEEGDLSVGDFLAQTEARPFSFSVPRNAERISIESENLVRNLLDIRYASHNTNDRRELTRIPDTYLYLWVDEQEFGRVYWNDTDRVPFTYIIQN
ncbi:hypothetical protein [Chitinivibrio alkaliphilus]|uniref:Lipoprotein n=1 Tax=Chitinivibrio alkaliphilus ACht1 TaxID=1313304 RepID=U7D4V3_9BACT|nr:hypothetical protein [Chitinivibrio alkaliphilus]ERP31544.1 hypothetical protein CALK_1589 [Chitinivibrio alkaliphilus ACht1]